MSLTRTANTIESLIENAANLLQQAKSMATSLISTPTVTVTKPVVDIDAVLIKNNRALSIYNNGRKVTEIAVLKPINQGTVSKQIWKEYRQEVVALYDEVRTALRSLNADDKTTRRRVFKVLNKSGVRYTVRG